MLSSTLARGCCCSCVCVCVFVKAHRLIADVDRRQAVVCLFLLPFIFVIKEWDRHGDDIVFCW